MTRHLDGDLLMDYAQGTLPGPERERWEKHVIDCAQCRTELAELLEAVGTLALSLPPIPPTREARARLMEAASGRPAHAMAERLARFFDLAVDATRRLVDELADAARWEKPPIPGLELFHLTAGPAVAGADAGFVRFGPSVKFPSHVHLGEERVMVVTGALFEDDGSVLRPGDVRVMPPGSRHSFETAPGVETLYALVLYTGVEIDGYPSISAKKG